MDLSTFPLGNAAGWVKQPGKDFNDLARSEANEIVLGSYCMLRRHGNIGETHTYDQQTRTSGNGKGLQSPPIEETLLFLPELKERAEGAKRRKTLIASFAGFSPEENAILAERLAPHAHMLECNGACGNVWGPTGRKPMPAYEPLLFEATLKALAPVVQKTRARIQMKMGVYDVVFPPDEDLVNVLAKLIRTYDFVERIVVGNTKINYVPRKEDGSPALSFRESADAEVKHVGGMGGRGVKPYALAAVARFRDLLPKEVGIIGCGGIFEGADLVEYMQAGASGCQIGTAYFESNAGIFSDVFQEADALLTGG